MTGERPGANSPATILPHPIHAPNLQSSIPAWKEIELQTSEARGAPPSYERGVGGVTQSFGFGRPTRQSHLCSNRQKGRGEVPGGEGKWQSPEHHLPRPTRPVRALLIERSRADDTPAPTDQARTGTAAPNPQYRFKSLCHQVAGCPLYD